MSGRAKSLFLPWTAWGFVPLLLGVGLATVAVSGIAFAQGCNGPCGLDRLLLPISMAPAASPARSIDDTRRWTISAEAIVLARTGGVDRTLVGRVPGGTQWFATNIPGAEALNSNQFDGVFSAGPKLGLTYRIDSGWSVELSYFNVFDQRATKTIGPDNPADWLVMQAPGTFWQTQDFAYQGMAWATATNLYSAEANARLDLSGTTTVLAGIRWLQLNDTLQGTLTPPDLMVPDWKQTCYLTNPAQCQITQIGTGRTPAGNYPPFWTTSSTNNLYGVQVGVDAKLLERGRFSLGGQIKAGLFDNHAQQSTVVSMQKQLYPSQATTDRAAFVGEAGLRLKYRVSDVLALKVSYQALWLAGVALAPGQIGVTSTTPSSVTALGVDAGSHALFHGATAGLEYSF